MNGFLYLLESVKSKRRYLGSTINPNNRIFEHNNNRVKATKNKGPWKCLFIINVGDIAEAKKIEFYIKRQKERLSVRNVVKIINEYYIKSGL